MQRIWTFKTRNFVVALDVAPEDDLDLSWDEDGETAAMLENGEAVAFHARVTVHLDGREIGSDSLGDCIYLSVEEFVSSHRDPDPQNRNCTLQKPGYVICHYFPDMVRQAIADAREFLGNAPLTRSV